MYKTLSGQGRLYDKDSDELLAAVRYVINLKEPTPMEHGRWSGDFTLRMPQASPKVHLELLNRKLRLELEDGRSGDLVIKRSEVSSRGGLKIRFSGSGPLE